MRRTVQTLLLAVAVASCGNPFGDRPLERSEVAVSITGTYMGYSCGESCPQIRPERGLPASLDTSYLKGGLTLQAPHGLEAPDQLPELRVPGNRFELRGYYHYVSIDGKRFLHGRFDVIAWRPVLPYQVWRSDGTAATVSRYSAGTNGWRSQEPSAESPSAVSPPREDN